MNRTTLQAAVLAAALTGLMSVSHAAETKAEPKADAKKKTGSTAAAGDAKTTMGRCWGTAGNSCAVESKPGHPGNGCNNQGYKEMTADKCAAEISASKYCKDHKDICKFEPAI